MARRSKTLKEYLDKKLGEASETAVDELLAIAAGKTAVKVQQLIPGMPGAFTTVEVVASPRERAEILFRLMDYQHGRPRQQLDVQHSQAPKLYDPDRLTSEELETMARIERKALVSGDTDDDDVIDAEMTDSKEPTE